MSPEDAEQFAVGQLIALALAVLFLALIAVFALPARAAQDVLSAPGASAGTPRLTRGGADNSKTTSTEDRAESGAAGSRLILKRFELLKQAVPGIVRVGVLWHPDAENANGMLQDIGTAVLASGLSILFVAASDPVQLETAMSEISSGQVDAIIVMPSSLLLAHRKYVVDRIGKIGLPAMYPAREFVQDGGLMSYGPNLVNIGRGGARDVDAIVREKAPVASSADPPTRPALVLNLKAARRLGLNFSPEFLVLADEVLP